MNPEQPEQDGWAADIDFTITGWTDGADDRQPHRPGLPLRWCAGAAVLMLLAVLLSGGLYLYRTRVITTKQVLSSGGAATLDLTGCPLSDTCSYLSEPGAALLPTAERYFSISRQLQAATVFDTTADATYRASLVLGTSSKLTLSIVAQCIPNGPPLAAWQSPIPPLGPAEIVLVVPGEDGCSVAVSTQVPAGMAVPATALRRLAADPDLQLQP
ncbi:MAG: hypothetical protein M3Y77_14605 [Actinomycetota bacterium]|nr:hypothetical protein [Actinomycetota bacterium]MDQ2956631.1 hypothetical protein [Actinomycetota bacterium]